MFLSSIKAFQKCPGSRFRLPDQLQKLIITSWAKCKSVRNILSNPVDKQTDKLNQSHNLHGRRDGGKYGAISCLLDHLFNLQFLLKKSE